VSSNIRFDLVFIHDIALFAFIKTYPFHPAAELAGYSRIGFYKIIFFRYCELQATGAMF
jgi:hypothetical protein